MLRVLQNSFTNWPAVETKVDPLEHLRWKLGQGKRRHLVAEVQGKIVATRLALASAYAANGQRLTCSFEADSAVVPAFRAQGVYAEIIRYGIEVAFGGDMNLASVSRPSIVEINQEIGHRQLRNRIVQLSCNTRALHPVELAKRTAISFTDAFDGRIEEFWAKAAAPYDFISMPSRDDLNWRYLDHRGGLGSVLQADSQDEILGFAALRVSHGRGAIANLLALPERIGVVRDLISTSLAHFAELGIDRVDCALPAYHAYSALLVEEGFIRKDHTVPLSCRATRPSVDTAFAEDAKAPIHVMLGDTDLV